MLHCSLLMFIVGIYSLVKNREHILLILLSLELMMLGSFLLLSMFLVLSLMEVVIFYLIVVVCEACLGLSVMIMCVFYYGNDFFNTYSILSC